MFTAFDHWPPPHPVVFFLALSRDMKVIESVVRIEVERKYKEGLEFRLKLKLESCSERILSAWHFQAGR